MKKIWIKSATLKDFAEIEIGDWIEGVGMIMSHFEKDFIRRFGARHLTSKSSGQGRSTSLSPGDYPGGVLLPDPREFWGH